MWQKKAKEHLILPEKIEQRVALLRQEGKAIVSINGSFDIMHAGHLEILYQASLLGDYLIVALNTDSSIKNYKGPNRPFVSLEHRLEMVAAVRFVDFVTYFSEPTPCAILEKIKPDWHVNGAEYGMECIEAPVVKKYGGKIVLVNKVGDLSTTKLCNAIRSTCELSVH